MKNTLLLSILIALSGLVACGPGESERTPNVLELDRDVAAGLVVYQQNCMECHLADLTGDSGPDITDKGDLEDNYVVDLIIGGTLFMPGFGEEIDDQQAADLLGYLRSEW